MSEETKYDIVIIGSGPAGLTAAIYAARADLKPLLIEGPQPGGQLTITTEVENYPGFSKGIQGPELMEEMREQARRFGTEFITSWISDVDLSRRPFTLHTEEHTIHAETMIIASGASAKWLGIPGEAPAPEGLGGYGVSACATCDGFFFKGKPIVIGLRCKDYFQAKVLRGHNAQAAIPNSEATNVACPRASLPAKLLT